MLRREKDIAVEEEETTLPLSCLGVRAVIWIKISGILMLTTGSLSLEFSP